jgi:hypothetical protein
MQQVWQVMTDSSLRRVDAREGEGIFLPEFVSFLAILSVFMRP